MNQNSTEGVILLERHEDAEELLLEVAPPGKVQEVASHLLAQRGQEPDLFSQLKIVSIDRAEIRAASGATGYESLSAPGYSFSNLPESVEHVRMITPRGVGKPSISRFMDEMKKVLGFTWDSEDPKGSSWIAKAKSWINDLKVFITGPFRIGRNGDNHQSDESQ